MTAVRLREGVPQGVSAVVVNEPGSYDGTAIDIDPFAEGQTFGGFQSDPGQGASRPIFVTFKAPLSDTLSVTILDPDFDVNSAKAGFVDGHHETQNFLGDNNPGAFKSSTITFGPGVSSLLLTPASNDYVAYSLVYGPTGIALDCSATGTTVIRGGFISCNAVRSGDVGGLAVTGWSYTNVNRGVNIVRSSNPTSVTWGGEIVIDGTIEVMGTIDGVPSTASAAIQVIPRDWSAKVLDEKISLIASGDPKFTLPALPTKFNGQFGSTESLLALKTGSDFTSTFETIGSGVPNSGLIYFTALPVEGLHDVQINTLAMSVGSAFYNQQELTTRTIGSRTFCGRDFLVSVLPSLVEAHEGISGQKKSHVGIFQAKAQALAKQEFERFVVVDPMNGFKSQFDSVATRINAAANIDSNKMDSDSRNNLTNVSSPCEFHY